MGQDEHIAKWVKEHKKEFARRLIRESGAEKSGQPAAIFMAGLPGAGKTEVSRGLIRQSNLKVIRLDMDEIAAQIDTYQPQKADRFRRSASVLLTEVFDRVIRGGYNFMMDGTFGGGLALQNIERVLKRKYDLKIIYVQQDPRRAWEYTVAREKVEHRAIDLDGFVESYFRTIQNLLKLKDFEDVKLDIFVKDHSNGVKKWIRNISTKDIDQYVKVEYNDKKALKEYLDV